MLCEQIKHFGMTTLRWLLQMMNSILKTHKFPKLWRKSKVIAILKPGKDSTLSKSFRPISLLCHTYKLFERMILNRLNPLIETMIIDQQAGFRPGKSTTGQLLNLTQHIKDGNGRGVVAGTVFVDLSAAYDTISHKLLLNKIYRMTSDIKFTDLIGNMLSNRRYLVELNGQKSRWRNQKNGFPKEVCYHLCSPTFTQMTNQYTRTLGVSSTQTTYVLRHRMHHLRRPNQPVQYETALATTTRRTICLPTQTRHRHAYSTSGTEKRTDS